MDGQQEQREGQQTQQTQPEQPEAGEAQKAGRKPPTMRTAAIIQFASKYVNILVQLLITAVLARLITPEAFGILAICSVFTAFFSMFADMGLGVAIIQFRDLGERDFGSLFFFSVLLGLCLMALFCACSPLIAWFYGDDTLVPLCCLGSLALLFNTLNMVPNGLMLREKRFKSIGVRLVVSTVLAGCIAIVLAFAGWGCYALILQSVGSAAIVLVWNLLSRPVHDINRHFVPVLKRVFSYSAYQFGFTLINYFSRNLDNLVIGKVLGTAELGFYDKAYRLTTYPLTVISSVIASVVQPYMAEYQDQPKRIFQCWWDIAKFLSLVAVPVVAVFVCAAPEIFGILYGGQWDAAVPLFQALSISVYVQMLGNPSGAFYQSLGRTDLMFRVGLINTCITVAGLVTGVLIGGLQTVACCVAAAFVLHMVPMAWFLLYKGFGESPRCLLRFLPEIVAGAVTIGICFLVGYLLPGGFPGNIVVRLVIKLALIALILVPFYALTGQFKHVLKVIGRRK